jgi:hypothetical protein
MAAIMPSKWWNREKSFFMFLTLANFLEPNNEVCNWFENELTNLWTWIFTTKELKLDSTTLKNIENIRKESFDGQDDEPLLRDTQCSNYINKAIRELNLEYIDQADAKYQQDNWTHSWTAKELYELWYMDYLPIDFQQYEDYGIIYIYKESVWNYDYEMGRY